MGLLGLSVDTDSAERSPGSAQRSADSTVRIKQYSKKGGTVFGLFGPQLGSNPARVDSKTLSPDSSGVSSGGSSYHGSPERRKQRSRSEPRRSKSLPRRRQREVEPSPGSDYGSLHSDVEGDSTGEPQRLTERDSLKLKSEEFQKLTEKASPALPNGESPSLAAEGSPDDDGLPRQRRQRQRSASESISDRLSESQAQKDRELEELWPESNSLDRNTSQYGNNAASVRNAKLQNADALHNGCQAKTDALHNGCQAKTDATLNKMAVEQKSGNGNSEVKTAEANNTESIAKGNTLRVDHKTAAARTGSHIDTSSEIRFDSKAAVETMCGARASAGECMCGEGRGSTGGKSVRSESFTFGCQDCVRERQNSGLPKHTRAEHNTGLTKHTRAEHNTVLPKHTRAEHTTGSSTLGQHYTHYTPALHSHHSHSTLSKPKHPAALLPKSRSFVLPQRPRLGWDLRRPVFGASPCSGSVDRVQGPAGGAGGLPAAAGRQPGTYLKHSSSNTCTKQQNTSSTHINYKSSAISTREQFLAGFTQNKCNNISPSVSSDWLTSLGNGCHGDSTGTGSWVSVTSGVAGCHGSACCLSVVQDVLSRIPVTPCNTQQLNSLDLSSCNPSGLFSSSELLSCSSQESSSTGLLPCNTQGLSSGLSSCNSSAFPTSARDSTPCTSQYVPARRPLAAPHYATMRVKRSASALMGNLPCWKQRHLHDDGKTNNKHPNGNAYGDGHGLVTIRMKPDSQGRFGFNVKGGADQGMPIIVSRVAPNTPADVCIPRLNEGDQVLYINGRDVSQHTHEQVVMFIRASRETHSGELVLVVRPNIYIGDDANDAEPDFVYNPDTHDITSNLPPGSDPLAGSIMLLSESLESGAALAQFEQMYRKKPGLTHNAARANDNICKNRYRDISPYDQSRVYLKGGGGDYINANYVNMEIPGSGVVNRYIAAQGPLPNTCKDFWQMVWEQQCRLIAMLTTKVERGRVKCHQYWPDLYETMDYGKLQVTCLKEDLSASFAFREFTLVNIEDGQEERHIRQMQYLAWPDHGVPDDSSDFLAFVMRVRQNRTGMVEPTVVHCSAGIGRTGVLITMETAMCLMEANQPIYPLDIVRQMRDQRAMLIQTSSQYKFVCEAITRVYHALYAVRDLVKPKLPPRATPLHRGTPPQRNNNNNNPPPQRNTPHPTTTTATTTTPSTDFKPKLPARQSLRRQKIVKPLDDYKR